MSAINKPKIQGLKVISIKRVAFIFSVIFVFLLSLIVGPYYTSGDQTHYRLTYDAVSLLSFIDGFLYYNNSLASYEFVHYSLIWLFSRLLDKDVFIAISNAVLGYLLLINLNRIKVYTPLAIILVLSNFYLFVLYFAAERLKYGMIFLLLSLYYIQRAKFFYPFIFLSVISHVQFIILYLAMAFSLLKIHIMRFFTNGLVSKKILFFLILIFILAILLNKQIVSKFLAYYGTINILDLWKMFMFFTLSLWYSKSRKLDVLLIFIPLIIAVALFGGERVNMFGYFVFMYYALQVNRGVNFGVLVTTFYFGFQTLFFVENILIFGDGFYAD
jgi:hypothetical protein